jgi:hypothetical protein
MEPNLTNHREIVKAYSPGVGSISDLIKSLEETGWTRYSSEDKTSEYVMDYVNNIEDSAATVVGRWKLNNPDSRIIGRLSIDEISENVYFVAAHLTNGTDYDFRKHALLSFSSVPTFIIRHILGEADKCIYGLTDENHNGIYTANRIH